MRGWRSAANVGDYAKRYPITTGFPLPAQSLMHGTLALASRRRAGIVHGFRSCEEFAGYLDPFYIVDMACKIIRQNASIGHGGSRALLCKYLG
jgi:hypothetical protein